MAIVALGFGDVVSDLKVAEGEVAHVLEAALRDVGQSALEHFRGSWPVDTGRSLAGWQFRMNGLDGVLFNVVPYTSFVHNGLADRLWEEVMTAAEKDVTLLLSERVAALVERG